MTKDRLGRILSLALPIIGGMVSQNVLNLVDTAMVGSLGDAALAAVGLGGFVAFMAMAIVLGVSSGVQATAARRKGEGRHDRTAVALNAGLLLVVVIAPPLTAVLYYAVPELYPYLNADPEVVAHGVPYLQMRVLAIVFVGINFAFRGYWNAIDRSMLYMSTLIVMHTSNIFFNYVFIFGNFGAPQMGAEGAGMASAMATVVGASVYFVLGFKYAAGAGFFHGLPSRSEIWTLAKLSLPSGVQQLFFSAGFTALYWIIGRVGTAELAAANVTVNVMLVALLPGIGFGLAAATFVGQALGRGDVDGAAQWGNDVMRVAMVVMIVLGLPMWLAPDLITSFFITNPDTVALARGPLRLVGLAIGFEAVVLVLMNALLGAGDARRVMLVSIGVQWLVFLPVAYLVGPVLGFGLMGIWLMQMLYRVGLAGVFATMWQRRAWADIKV